MKYRLPKLSDKEEIISYIQEHYARGERSLSASNLLTSMAFEDWIKKVHDNAEKPDEVWGKSLTYLIISEEEKLIGLVNIRYALPQELVQKYGHIGIGIRPSERRKGYAKEALNFALNECKRLGLKKVVLGCYKENVGSAKSIIKNGGRLIREVDDYEDINGYYKINLKIQYYEIDL